MLPRDKNGVVDQQLKVYGTRNIRVVDLSVVPLMPSVHPQGSLWCQSEPIQNQLNVSPGTVYTIAEIGAHNGIGCTLRIC